MLAHITEEMMKLKRSDAFLYVHDEMSYAAVERSISAPERARVGSFMFCYYCPAGAQLLDCLLLLFECDAGCTLQAGQIERDEGHSNRQSSQSVAEMHCRE